MTALREDVWLEAAAAINDLWPDKPLPPYTVTSGYALLRELKEPLVLAAIAVLIREGREFPPVPGIIYAKAVEMAEGHAVWAEVWHEVMTAVSHHGHGKDPASLEWSSDLVYELVTTSGWHELCTGNIADLPIVEAQWRNKYEALRRRRKESMLIRAAGLPALTEGISATVKRLAEGMSL